ncbi:5-oxoprolinase subunit PxpB [Cupriavidus necator]|uniref:Allophanate hydrolase subunit 1 n=1 Tax=Cupriavidus necator TaxID=106590 RepID=A0A367PIZ5_CUPNE|nr:5-oxoprolinase subunit PxpB [Cupriavidus necator]QQX82744.1 5-oxoprolinase subunit PxpB [Cupriavidus necator]RCJ07513.1 allophanate hydrolase subunit 1 [Cupriavidus necator]
MTALPVDLAPVAAIPWHIEPSGDRLLVVAFDAGRDATALRAANRQACAAAVRIAAAALPGVTDVVPALATLGIHYRPSAVGAAAGTAPFRALSAALSALLAQPLGASTASARVVDIPVCYGGDHGPDLEEVAASCGLAPDAVVALHSAAPVDVLMLGFAPGHPYVGKFDARLAPPRRSTPRTAVPAGSIGLANCQSVIYPMVLPGGWNLIGRTPLALFDPHRDAPCLLNAGDQVRFVPVSAAQFDEIAASQGTPSPAHGVNR